MHAKPAKWTFRSLSVLGVIALLNIGATCSYQVRNTEVCTVAGVMSAGMDCGNTRNDDTRSMTFDQALDYLEPQLARPDPNNPKKTIPERAGAMCQSAEDFNIMKTDLEILCEKMGDNCTYEIKEQIQKTNDRMNSLMLRNKRKAKPKPKSKSIYAGPLETPTGCATCRTDHGCIPCNQKSD